MARRKSKIGLLDSHLLIPFEWEGTGPRFRRLIEDVEEIGRFLRNTLLYDRIAIPTVDLMAVPMVATWIGPENLIAALESRVIQFVRYPGAIGYHGDGVGLAMFELHRQRGGVVSGERHDLTWAPADQVLDIMGQQIQSLEPLAKPWPALRRVALDHLIEIDPRDFTSVAQATYQDIDNSPILRTYFSARHPDLKHLRGLSADQTRWLHSNLNNDDIDTLLHMAAFNWESYMAERVGAVDQVSGPAAQTLLRARIEEHLRNSKLADGFVRTLNLNRFPDFSAAAANDSWCDRIWRARGSRDATEFRQWFHEHVRDNPDDAERRFVDEWGKRTLGDHWMTKALRFVAFDVAPSFVPGLSAGISIAANAADAFLLDRFLKPKSPKVMLDNVRAHIGRTTSDDDQN